MLSKHSTFIRYFIHYFEHILYTFLGNAINLQCEKLIHWRLDVYQYVVAQVIRSLSWELGTKSELIWLYPDSFEGLGVVNHKMGKKDSSISTWCKNCYAGKNCSSAKSVYSEQLATATPQKHARFFTVNGFWCTDLPLTGFATFDASISQQLA